MNLIEMNEECRRCAHLDAGCGREWTPQIHIGDSGHVEGCMDYAPKADADGGTASPRQQGETVREVCAEIEKDTIGLLGFESKPWNQLVFPFSLMATAMEMLADRILEAYEREMAAKDAEIARLKAASVEMIHINEDGNNSKAIAAHNRVAKAANNKEEPK